MRTVLQQCLLAFLIFSLCFLFSVSLYAFAPEERSPNPLIEERAQAIFKNVRCVVCQGQSIADSEAAMAQDLRGLIRKELEAGLSPAEVMEGLVARYGEFILMKPRFAPHTWGLWLAPPLILLLGGSGVLFFLRRKQS